jgi:hypothetical protein
LVKIPKLKITRRSFVIGSAVVAGGAVASYFGLKQFNLLPSWLVPYITLNPNVSVVRPDDLLVLTFEFENLEIKSSEGKARLGRSTSGQPAYIIVHFQPQNITEQAFYEYVGTDFKKEDDTGTRTDLPAPLPQDNLPAPLPAQSRISGPSRLVFKVPDNETDFDYTLEELLARISRYDLWVAPVATPPPPPGHIAQIMTGTTTMAPPTIAEPAPDVTSIEMPYRLMISPSNLSAWAHSPSLVTHKDSLGLIRTELWHTRLGVRDQNTKGVDEISDYYRTIRAIWSPDFLALSNLAPSQTRPHFPYPDYPNGSQTQPLPKPPPPNYRTSLDAEDRNEIVHLSSDFNLQNFNPQAIQVDRLMLSSLGAWMDSRGAWEPPSPLSVEEWRHRATMGRDHYVRVVYRGYLFPFGHRASLIKVTERKFRPQPPDTPVTQTAYLFQRMFIVVRQPIVQYRVEGSGQPNGGRKFPFVKVQLTTLTTPDLNPPENHEVVVPANPPNLSQPMGQDAFWPQSLGSNQDFVFHAIAEDLNGIQTELAMPLIFASNLVATNKSATCKVTDLINAYMKENLNRKRLVSSRIAFAPASDPTKADTTFETSQLSFGAEQATSGAAPTDRPLFFPTMEDATVRIPAIQQVQGTGGKAETTVQYYQTYIENEFAPAKNPGQAFLKVPQSAEQAVLDFSQNADKAGALVTPVLNITGLSRLVGPTAGNIDTIANGKFDPAEYFGSVSNAKILGGIKLVDLISSGQGIEKAPKVTTQVEYANLKPELPANMQKIPTALTTTIHWDPGIQTSGIFVASNAALYIDGTLRTGLGGQPSTAFKIYAHLTSFEFRFLPSPATVFLRLPVNRLEFTATSGAKVHVSCELGQPSFEGPLTFVDRLKDYIPLTGLVDPPYLDVDASGIKAGYSLAIPNIALGAWALENINLSLGLTIPFVGSPARVRFAFAEREHPFHLRMSLFTGGGFFAMSAGLDEIELMEAALEFGGSFSLDLGVASGGVSAMAGIYIELEKITNPSPPPVSYSDAKLTGYFRSTGGMEVLGIVAINIEIYLGLTYDIDKHDAWGQATFTVEVEVAMFHKSVDISAERHFSHSSPPSMEELVTQEDWNNYAQAFALS